MIKTGCLYSGLTKTMLKLKLKPMQFELEVIYEKMPTNPAQILRIP